MITIVVIVAAAVFVALITTLVVRDRARERRLAALAAGSSVSTADGADSGAGAAYDEALRAEAEQARARTDAAAGTANRAQNEHSGF